MKRKAVRILSLILVLSLLASMAVTQAAGVTFAVSKSNKILDTIASTYSAELRGKIADLLFDSDYSDHFNRTDNMRNAALVGGKAWPITNADSYGTSVTDRGQKVKWGWGRRLHGLRPVLHVLRLRHHRKRLQWSGAQQRR